MTTPLFLLRCVEIGLSVHDLDLLTVGLVTDMFTEKGNDDYYEEKNKNRDTYIEARQTDFDRF